MNVRYDLRSYEAILAVARLGLSSVPVEAWFTFRLTFQLIKLLHNYDGQCLLVTSEVANQKTLKVPFTCVVFWKRLLYAKSVSGQDEPNLALWLATRAGKMELSCLLGIRALSRKYTGHALALFSHIINRLLTKFARARWLDIGQVLFLNTQKKELGQYPSILTSPLVNNPYILSIPVETSRIECRGEENTSTGTFLWKGKLQLYFNCPPDFTHGKQLGLDNIFTKLTNTYHQTCKILWAKLKLYRGSI